MEEEERNYIESEDEDFNPETADAGEEDVSSSSDEDESATTVAKTAKAVRKRKPAVEEELDSGDEATIQERRRKKRKSGDKQEDDSGGEGGLVKTRAQRRAEKEERREFRRTNKGPVTIDVDSLWASLSAAPVGRTSKLIEEIDETGLAGTEARDQTRDEAAVDENELITIKHSYTFAGQTVTEEKQVHRDSAEARLYLSNQEEKPQEATARKHSEDGVIMRKPLKRASRFEPNPTGEVKGVPLHKQRLRTPSRADVLAQQQRLEDEAKASGGKAQRLNTVQKSKLDWVSHVDAEGFKDELDEYGRSKQGYMDKMDFLQNVQGKRDLEERQARLQQV
ncbi:bucentaur or craniofacial development-domain-containing protein [Elsinoe ampelina]|uniref:SWR1-complex protein 5 n=1 Tax=Elsinoe ampelina TaxID=302913 RepID=A0A6A6GAX3_9PEZI|nr:bucentaur or craniofacial development-domain-containing protein [Elsinoe ampelina]